MAEARILITGVVIRTTGLSEFTYSKYGSVMGFTYLSAKYRFCIFKINNGFYALEDYQNYIRSKASGDDKLVIKPYTGFNYAKAGDEIYVYIREMTSLQAGNPSVCWQMYKFNFSGTHPKEEYKPITLTPGAQAVGAIDCLHSVAGNNFFNSYISKAIISQDNELANILADIQQSIDKIESNVFSNPLFSGPEASAIITQQRNLWSDGVTYDFINKSDYHKLITTLAYFILFYESFKTLIGDDIVLMYIYFASVMHSSALDSLSVELKLKVLGRLAHGDLDNFQMFKYKPEDDESIVANVIRSVTYNQSTFFLSKLIDERSEYTPNDYYSLFNLFWDGIQDLTLGKNNKRKFMAALYEVWKKSTFNPYRTGVFDPILFQQFTYNTLPATSGSWGFGATNSIVFDYGAKPFSINYQSIKFIGFYFDDFNFYFSKELKDYAWKVDNVKDAPANKIFVWKTKDETDSSQMEGLRGTYDIFQPISLFDSNQQAMMQIPVINGDNATAVVAGHPEKINNLIPVFLLKYIDDAGDESDFWTFIGYFVDVLSLFAGGAGIINKLKYLRYLSKFDQIGTVVTATYIAIGVEGLQVAATAARFLTGFVDGCDTDPKWIKIRTVLIWMEIGAGGLDILATRNIKIKAREVVDDFNTTGWPPEFLNTSDGISAKNELARISGLSVGIDAAILQQVTQRIKKVIPVRIAEERKRALFKILEDSPVGIPVPINQIPRFSTKKYIILTDEKTAQNTGTLLHTELVSCQLEIVG